MRPLDDWKESDLESLISYAVEENLRLDYKRAEALAPTDSAKNELAKDVSAFANSAGGRIIYGMIEEGPKPIKLAGVTDKRVTREWIEQVINSRISSRISGITIKPIPLQSGGYAFVIDIPQSQAQAPHQAPDKKYYKRYNFHSIPMEDYEVRDTMRRNTKPHPVIFFTYWDLAKSEHHLTTFNLAVNATNKSDEPVLYGTMFIGLDERIVSPSTVLPDGFTRKEKLATSLHVNGEVVSLERFQYNLSVPTKMPLFKEMAYTLGVFQSLSTPSDGEYLLGYSVSCPGFRFEGLGMIDVRDGVVSGKPEQLDLLNPERT